MAFKTWSDLEAPLATAWQEVSSRKGSFADAPCEAGDGLDATLEPMFPIEQFSHSAIKAWIDGGVLPAMPPAANRYTEVRFYGALGLVRRLAELPNPALPADWPPSKILRWLLFDVHADTIQVALDNLRVDLLSGRPS